MKRLALSLSAASVLLAGCPQLRALVSPSSSSRVIVALDAGEAESVGKALAVVERAVVGVPGVVHVRSVGCTTGGAAIIEGSANATAVHAAVSAVAQALPPGISPLRVDTIAADVRVLSVRAADPFAARAFVDTSLLPALQALGDVGVVVSGARREKQVRIDPERLLAADVALPEVLTTIRTASDLDKAVIKSSPLGTIRLRDVAVIDTGSAGEPLRKDGGVQVRVRGNASRGSAIDAAIATAPLPTGVSVATLDADSVEVVTILVSREGAPQQQPDPVVVAAADSAVDAAWADVAAAALAIPGVHTFRRGRHLQLTLDRQRVEALGLNSSERQGLADVASIATTGLQLTTRGGGSMRVLLGTAATPEALLSTRVATRRTGTTTTPVRLFDVARAAFVEEQRLERVDGRSARRLRLSLDAGVRKVALADLDTRLAAIRAARPGIAVTVERDGDTAPLDVVCP